VISVETVLSNKFQQLQPPFNAFIHLVLAASYFQSRKTSQLGISMVAAATVTYSTAGTISSPLDLEAKGEHSAVSLDSNRSKRKVVRPKVKVTLTSLTPNNVGIMYHTSIGRYACSARASASGTGVWHSRVMTIKLILFLQSGTLRKLNSVVLPIVYSEKFYKDVLDPSLDDINKLSASVVSLHGYSLVPKALDEA
jgi:hypothetical protein